MSHCSCFPQTRGINWVVCFFPQLDEYDMMVRELGFEMKAQPSEKLKTPEELAREERERLQTLEVRSPPPHKAPGL